MKIDDLDESQGMTREMVDHYLNRNGWCNMPDPDQRLLKPQYEEEAAAKRSMSLDLTQGRPEGNPL